MRICRKTFGRKTVVRMDVWLNGHFVASYWLNKMFDRLDIIPIKAVDLIICLAEWTIKYRND